MPPVIQGTHGGEPRVKSTAPKTRTRMSMGGTTMQNELSPTLQLTLTSGHDVGHISVPLEHFLSYDLWITQSLETLVDRWMDQSAPSVTRGAGHFPS